MVMVVVDQNINTMQGCPCCQYQLYNNIFAGVMAGKLRVGRGLIDERDVEGNFSLEIEEGIPGDGGAEGKGLLVVEEGGRQQVELVHGSAKVVVNFLKRDICCVTEFRRMNHFF